MVLKISANFQKEERITSSWIHAWFPNHFQTKNQDCVQTNQQGNIAVSTSLVSNCSKKISHCLLYSGSFNLPIGSSLSPAKKKPGGGFSTFVSVSANSSALASILGFFCSGESSSVESRVWMESESPAMV